MMEKTNQIPPVIIFTGTYWQAQMVKSLLENAEIESYLLGETKGTFNLGWSLPGEQGSVRVMVAGEDLELARSVVEEYEKNLKTEE